MEPTHYPLTSTQSHILRFAVLAIGVIYIASCLTPLHIHFDSIRYYNIKDCIEYGCPPNSFAATDYLPYGYTGLLIALSKLGILNSFSIILINCVYLFLGLYFIRKMFNQQGSRFLYLVLILFNWTIIKFVTHPLSEMQYIFFSASSLYCFHLYTQRKGYFFLALSFILCILTILTRTVGICLVPTLVLGVLWQHKDELKRVVQKNKILLFIITALAIGVAFFLRQLKIVDYTSLLKEPLQKGLLNFIGTNFKNHFLEIAEVFLNVPSNKIMTYLPASMGNLFFIACGLIFFSWFMYNTFSKRSRIPFYVKVYLFFYCIIILNWPYYDPRFWVPILPLMVVIILRTPFNRNKILRPLSRLYLAVYIFFGLLAAAYSLYIGFSKERFAQNQAAGAYRNEYETYFFGKPQSDTARHINQNVVDILRKYD